MNKPNARTVSALLDEIAARDPHHCAIVDGQRSWTYADLIRDVRRTAAALAGSGITHGDRVGILAGNRAEWVIAYFATMHLGAIAVGLNTWSTARELAYQLGHAEVKLLFLEPRFRERDFVELFAQASAIDNGFPTLQQLVTFGSSDGTGIDFATWLERSDGNVADAAAPVASDDIACLLYTSGSTATPKGVPLLHAGLIDNMWEIGERQHLGSGDRLWLAVSLFWSLACVNALFAAVTHGVTIVLQHHFDPGEALSLIHSERCTVFCGTPNMVLALAEHERLHEFDLGSLRTGVTIGTTAQLERAAALGIPGICNVYGLTEAYGNSAVTDAALPLARRVETVGRALPGVTIKINHPETGAPLPPETPGEIVLYGRVTPGYWRDPERTAEATSADGGFRTGDLGLLDADGYLYYRGRLKEMVKTGGINVAPAEVEQVLSAHPAVELAFVTGLPDPRLDEVLVAAIVMRSGATTDAASLTAHCRASLAAYKTPRDFRFVEAGDLPLTSTGKLERKRLAGLFA
jgi:fatty-acyl-CoA synthase